MEPPMVTRLFFLYTYRPYDDVVVGVGENPSFYEFGETKLHDFSWKKKASLKFDYQYL